MTPFLDDGDVQVYVGDSRDVLAELPEKSVHAILTSPPFFGLRDYGTGSWEGGRPDCAHERPTTTMNAGFNERWNQGGGEKRQERKSGGQYAGECPKCGAVRVDRQIGLEATPDEWTASLVEVFAACRRVLRDDGSLWVEVGDSYSAGKRGLYAGDGARAQSGLDTRPQTFPSRAVIPDLKEKDLVGAPYLLAFALRADGWYWRGAYVWEKPDAMPESTRDRCTTSHSTVLHFAKSRYYFFDRDAIREPFSDYSTGGDGGSYGGNADDVRPANGRGPRGSTTYVRNRGGVPDGQVTLDGQEPEQEVVGADGRTVTTRTTGSRSHDNYGEFGHDEGRERWPSLEGRSPRSVWRITTEANSFGLCPACRRYWPERAPARHCDADVVAHFAVWPHRLVERIVACSTSEAGVCGDCGAPRRRTTELDLDLERPQARRALELAEAGNLTATHIAAVRAVGISDGGRAKLIQSGTGRNDADVQALADEAKAVLGGYCREFLLGKPSTTGWAPTCECAAPTVPATVLDPFGGSGTTARQARKMGRRCVLVELSPDYAEIAAHRLSQLALPLAIDA